MVEIEYTEGENAEGGTRHELKLTEEFRIGEATVYPGGVPVEGGEGWLVHWATSQELAGHIVCDGPNGCGVVASRPPTMHYDPDDPAFDDETYCEQFDRSGITPSEYARRLIREHAVRVHGALVFGGPDLGNGGEGLNLQGKPGDLLIFIQGDTWWVHVIEPRRDSWLQARNSPHAARIAAFRSMEDGSVNETGLYVLTEAGQLWRAQQYALSAGRS